MVSPTLGPGCRRGSEVRSPGLPSRALTWHPGTVRLGPAFLRQSAPRRRRGEAGGALPDCPLVFVLPSRGLRRAKIAFIKQQIKRLVFRFQLSPFLTPGATGQMTLYGSGHQTAASQSSPVASPCEKLRRRRADFLRSASLRKWAWECIEGEQVEQFPPSICWLRTSLKSADCSASRRRNVKIPMPALYSAGTPGGE